MDGSTWFTLDAQVGQFTTLEAGLIGTIVPVSRVAASNEYRHAGEVADNVLHSGEGKWLSRRTPAWLEFFLPEPAAVTAYTLTSADDVREVQLNRVQLLVKNNDRHPGLGEFLGILQRSDGPAIGYLGKSVTEITEPPEPDPAHGKVTAHPGPPRPDHAAATTAPSPDFDTIMAQGAIHRYTGGQTAVIRVLTDATLTLTSGHVTFKDPHEPPASHDCPPPPAGLRAATAPGPDAAPTATWCAC